MATTVVKHTYKLKRGKQEAVERNNPLLLAGEPIVVYCNDGKTRLKIGDGIRRYSELDFIGGTSSGTGSDIIIDTKLSEYSTNPVQNKVITEALYNIDDNKVSKEFGKGLSSNDYTHAEKSKLENIEDGATRVIVDSDLNIESTNAISNSLVTQEINEIYDTIEDIDVTMNQVIEEKVNQQVNESLTESVKEEVTKQVEAKTARLDGGEI